MASLDGTRDVGCGGTTFSALDLRTAAWTEARSLGDAAARRALARLVGGGGEHDHDDGASEVDVLRDVEGPPAWDHGGGDPVPASAREWAGGESVLLCFAQRGLEAGVRCLLQSPPGPAYLGHAVIAAGINDADVDGFTALHYACNLRLPGMVATLLRAGGDARARTRDVTGLGESGGRTPLHLAASQGAKEIVQMLLDAEDAAGVPDEAPSAGAVAPGVPGVFLQDWQGATPYFMACRHGHYDTARMLEDRARRVAGAAAAPVAAEVFENATVAPLDDELNGFALAEAMAVRMRGEMRRDIADRPSLSSPFVIPHTLTPRDCDAVVAAAEAAAHRRGGWLSTRHKHHPTVDIPVHDLPPAMYTGLRHLLDARILPAIRTACATARLHVKEAFVVKYEAKQGDADDAQRQASLGFHKDGTLLNCVVLLSDPGDFSGGGTVFAPPLDKTYNTDKGGCLCSCGQMLHGAAQVTRGRRYVMIAFIDEEMPAPED